MLQTSLRNCDAFELNPALLMMRVQSVVCWQHRADVITG